MPHLPAAGNLVTRAVALLAAAFADDPLYVWLFPDPAVRAKALQDNFAVSAGAGHRVGLLQLSADHDAVSVWTAPGTELLDRAEVDRVTALLQQHASDRIDIALAAMETCDSLHQPTDWILQLLATQPGQERRGRASRLLNQRLEQLDAAGASACLDSSNPDNLSFYRRHGFEDVENVVVGDDGPVITVMRRLPRTSRSALAGHEA